MYKVDPHWAILFGGKHLSNQDSKKLCTEQHCSPHFAYAVMDMRQVMSIH